MAFTVTPRTRDDDLETCIGGREEEHGIGNVFPRFSAE